MIRLFRWLIGYVEFIFSNGFANGFVNECYQQKINLHDIRSDGTAIRGICLAREYKKLHSIAHRHGGVVKAQRKRGLPFILLKIRNRWGLMAGALAFILIFNTLSGFVWSIEITGNEKIDSAELSEFLEENGFHIGTSWHGASLSTIENLVMASYDDCAWIHINRYGSKAVIEIDEAIISPETDNARGRANLKATKDGIITYTNIKRGWDIVKVGSAVTKGDLLASGVYESELNKTNHFTHASGVVIAKVREPVELTISRRQAEKIYTDESRKTSLLFFGLRLPLYIGATPSQDCDIEEKSEYLRLNGKPLPIGASTKICRKYVVEERTLNDKELKALINAELEEKLKRDFEGCEIIERSIKTTLNDASATAKGELVVLENIAEEVEF